jgi:hypothetical protein
MIMWASIGLGKISEKISKLQSKIIYVTTS